MFKFKTMQGRFTVFMLIPVGILLISAGLTGYFFTRNSLLQQWRQTAVLELQQQGRQRFRFLLDRPPR